jgi:phage terminase large subunit
MTVNIEIPEKLQFLFEPKRYKVVYSGRGAGKSWSFARVLLIKAMEKPLRVLCTRELQKSIRESVHKILSKQIKMLGLGNFFEIQRTVITGRNGSEFIFDGLSGNINAIQSYEGINVCWVEEAQSISELSWEILIPTIREEGSEIWVSFNPNQKDDPTYKMFVANPPPKDEATVARISWRDNKWFPEALRRHRKYLFSVDPETAAHVYEGETIQRSAAQVYKDKWVVEAFTPGEDWAGPYQGADWGAVHPTTLIRSWVYDDTLWIEYEVYCLGIDLDSLPDKFDKIPKARQYTTRADSARPETIRYMNNHGYPLIIAAQKWPGSVEDGIAHIRSYKRIVVHPRCEHTIDELRLYSYKVVQKTGDVLPDIVKLHDDCLDAVRYALAPLIKSQEFAIDPYMMQPEQDNEWESHYS